MYVRQAYLTDHHLFHDNWSNSVVRISSIKSHFIPLLAFLCAYSIGEFGRNNIPRIQDSLWQGSLSDPSGQGLTCSCSKLWLQIVFKKWMWWKCPILGKKEYLHTVYYTIGWLENIKEKKKSWLFSLPLWVKVRGDNLVLILPNVQFHH